MGITLSSGTETEITTRKHTKTLSVGVTTTRNFLSSTEATQNGFQLVYASCCSTHSVHVAGNGGKGGNTEEAFGYHRHISANFKARVRTCGLAILL